VNAAQLTKMRAAKADIRRELAQAWLREIETSGLEKGLPDLASANPDKENPFTWWQAVVTAQKKDKLSFADDWKKVATQFALKEAANTSFNQRNFTILADFRTGAWPDWQVGGQGLRDKPSRNGDFVVAREGDKALAALLPAGAYTHVLSDKLN